MTRRLFVGDFCIEVGRNICHGSDSVENAEREIELVALFALGLALSLAIVKGILGCGGGGDAGRGGGLSLYRFYMPTGAGIATLSVVFT